MHSLCITSPKQGIRYSEIILEIDKIFLYQQTPDSLYTTSMENQYLHEIAITAIIIKDDKYLITRRSSQKKSDFPACERCREEN